MKRIAFIALCFLCAPSMAQYRCLISGKTIYSDEPCAKNAAHVGKAQDTVPQSQVDDRLWLNTRQAAEVKDVDARQRQRDIQRAQDERRSAAAGAAHKRQCDFIEHQKSEAALSKARYNDIGWHGAARQQAEEMERLEEKQKRECR